MLDDLYKDYGKLLIQLEILQGKINEVKSKIVRELNNEAKADGAVSGKSDTKEGV